MVPGSAGSASWTMLSGVTVADNPQTGTVVVTDNESIGGQSKRFLRLHVQLPSP